MAWVEVRDRLRFSGCSSQLVTSPHCTVALGFFGRGPLCIHAAMGASPRREFCPQEGSSIIRMFQVRWLLYRHRPSRACYLLNCISHCSGQTAVFTCTLNMVGGSFSRSPAVAQLLNDASPTVDAFPLGEFSIDEHKPIKVVVIGAGFSGVIAGVRYVS